MHTKGTRLFSGSYFCATLIRKKSQKIKGGGDDGKTTRCDEDKAHSTKVS